MYSCSYNCCSGNANRVRERAGGGGGGGVATQAKRPTSAQKNE